MMSQAQPTPVPRTARSAEIKAAIRVARECESECIQVAQYCLRGQGPTAGRDHLTLLLDCAESAATFARYLLRGSDLHRWFAVPSAELAVRCADACAQFQDDETMMRAASACRRLAESCRRISAGR
jgi:hypothetical protein